MFVNFVKKNRVTKFGLAKNFTCDETKFPSKLLVHSQLSRACPIILQRNAIRSEGHGYPMLNSEFWIIVINWKGREMIYAFHILAVLVGVHYILSL